PAIFALVCFYMAMKSPFSIGGAAVTSWGNWGKKAWGKTGGQVTGAAKDSVTRRYNRAKMTAGNYVMNTKVGKSYERYTASQRFKDQLPVDVRTKAKENAERDVYQAAYYNHITKKKILPDAAYSRVVARNRKNIVDDQITYRNAEADALLDQLMEKGAIGDGGRLKSEIELAELSGENYVGVKAILKELREQTQKNATRDNAIPIWKRLTRGPEGIDDRNNVRRARYATAKDIARDLLPPPPPDPNVPVDQQPKTDFRYLSAEQLNAMERENPEAFRYPPGRRNRRRNNNVDDDTTDGDFCHAAGSCCPK
ncbi:MAG: hypothetical protein Athens101428_692, partial [Candidatus Berkelbacteria bacterium Athens1014_28]